MGIRMRRRSTPSSQPLFWYVSHPIYFFTRTLMSMRRSGMLRYGAFAHAVGEQFEKKWLHRSKSLNEEVLDIPDFSTTTDLYGVVHNIDDIRIDRLGKWTYNAPSEHPAFAAIALVVTFDSPLERTSTSAAAIISVLRLGRPVFFNCMGESFICRSLQPYSPLPACRVS